MKLNELLKQTKRGFLGLLMAFVCFGCASQNYEGLINHTGKERANFTYLVETEKEIIKDTVLQIVAPIEESRNELKSRDTSIIQTSFSISMAYFDNGVLQHTIKNKPFIQMPTRFYSLTKTVILKDSVFIRDTIYKEVQIVRTAKGGGWLNRFFASVVKIGLLLVLGWLAFKKWIK